MKNFGLKIYWFLFPAAILVCIDEYIKAFALRNFPDENTLTDRNFINLALHKNWGLSFDIPFRREFILLISVFIGYFLVKIAVQNFKQHPKLSFASMLILTGAIGNLYDRIVYGFTVDYLIFFGRTAINISDILIVYGVVLLLLASRQQKTDHEFHSHE
ncbi:MAG: signal peptidase II [Patescibacteria group bacterium]